MIAAIYVLFRSWRITGADDRRGARQRGVDARPLRAHGVPVQRAGQHAAGAGMILAIADDVHIVQHFNHELRATGSKEHAFKSSVQHLFTPLLGASGTTALGLLSLATSDVVAVRAFGIGSAVGVMVDFVMSLVFVPTLLDWLARAGHRAAGAVPGGADAAAGAVSSATPRRWRRSLGLMALAAVGVRACAWTRTTSTSSPRTIRCTSRPR